MPPHVKSFYGGANLFRILLPAHVKDSRVPVDEIGQTGPRLELNQEEADGYPPG